MTSSILLETKTSAINVDAAALTEYTDTWSETGDAWNLFDRMIHIGRCML
jgi:hypothetical protein